MRHAECVRHQRVRHLWDRSLVAKRVARKPGPQDAELVVITGLSGSGKATVLKAFEDLGYYAVDNMPSSWFPSSPSWPRIQRRCGVPRS